MGGPENISFTGSFPGCYRRQGYLITTPLVLWCRKESKRTTLSSHERFMKMCNKGFKTSGHPFDNHSRCGSGSGDVKWTTGNMCASNQATYAAWTNGRTNTIVNKGTWNVRGRVSFDKLSIVKKELKRNRMLSAGLFETQWRGSGHFKSENHHFNF